MNILFAYNLAETDNQFVQIHIHILQDLGYNVTASLDEFWQPTKTYDFLVINWPEHFFGWQVNISDKQVAKLNIALISWKRSATQILTFFHDEYSHFGRGANLNLLFDLCYNKSDILIHLGEYSKKKYTDLYRNAKHKLIYHPLYSDFKTGMDRNAARRQLNISEKEYLVFVPGGIRNNEEINYCLGIYRNLIAKNKRLIFQKTNFLHRPESLKSFIDLKVWFYYLIYKNKFKIFENISFLHGYMEKGKLSNYFAAADLVLIPRIDILNSGNILLAAQFGKPTIGTGAGNMKELLIFLKQQFIPYGSSSDFIISKTAINENQLKSAVQQYSNEKIIKQQWQQILKQ